MFTENKNAELFTFLKLLFIKMFKPLLSEAACYSLSILARETFTFVKSIVHKGPQQIAELNRGRENVDSINFFYFLSWFNLGNSLNVCKWLDSF